MKNNPPSESTSFLDIDRTVKSLSDDLLGREELCRELSEIILLPRGARSRVVSVEGGWGEGKSAILEMTRDYLGIHHANIKPFVVRISPWELGTSKDMTRSLLLSLSAQSKGVEKAASEKRGNELSLALTEYASSLAYITNDPIFIGVTLFAGASLKLVNKLSSLKTPDPTAKKRAINAAIAELDRPIVVIIDDADRLLPSEASELIRFVRAVGDFDRTCYVVAFENRQLTELLEKENVPNPSSYLDKIINYRTYVPPPSSFHTRKFLQKMLADSAGYIGRKQFPKSESVRTEILEFLAAPLLRHPRSIIAIVGAADRMALACGQDVEYWDIFALSVLQVRFPDIFSVIRRDAYAFTGSSDDRPFSAFVEDDEKVSPADLARALAEKVPDKVDSIYVLKLLKALFPTAFKVEFRSDISDGFINGRVRDKNNLYAVLNFGVPEWSTASSRTHEFVTKELGRREFLKDRFLSRMSMAEFLVNLRSEGVFTEQSFQIESPLNLAETILDAWSQLATESAESQEIDFENSRSIAPAILEILERSSDFEAGLLRICEKENFLPVSAILSDLYFEDRPSEDDGESVIAHKLGESIYRAVNVRGISRDYSWSLFAVKRLEPIAFARTIEQIEALPGGAQLVLGLLGVSIYSDTGAVAHWPRDLTESLPNIETLRMTAANVVLEGHGDLRVLRSARALMDGKAYVVSSGQRYSV